MEFALSLEFSTNEKNEITCWLGDDVGGSGIKVTASTPQEMVGKLNSYILDYFNNFN
jgi:hypothetical protein